MIAVGADVAPGSVGAAVVGAPEGDEVVGEYVRVLAIVTRL